MLEPEKLGWSWGSYYGFSYYQLGKYCLFQDHSYKYWILQKDGDIDFKEIIPNSEANLRINILSRKIKINKLINN